MTTYNELGITSVQEGQAQKEVTINEGLRRASLANGVATVGIVNGTNNLTTDQSLAKTIILTGALTGAATVVLDGTLTKATEVVNLTTGGQTVNAKIGAGGTPTAVPAGVTSGILIYPGGSRSLAGGGGGASSSKGLWSARPAAGSAGAFYYATDAPIISRDNGVSWDEWYGSYPIQTPDVADLPTWVNQVSAGGGTYAQAGTGPFTRLVFGSGAVGAVDNCKMVVKAAPATPYTIDALVKPYFSNDSFETVGICFRESATGKIISLTWYSDDMTSGNNPNYPYIISQKWSSPTAYSANFGTGSTLPGSGFPTATYKKFMDLRGAETFFRLSNDGTNISCQITHDLQIWAIVGIEPKAAFFTTGPDQVGMFVHKYNGSAQLASRLFSWVQG